MRKLGLALAATTCLTVAASIASAADLRPIYKPAPPPIMPAWSWNGFYLGAHIGGSWGTKEYTFATTGFVGDNSHTVNGLLGGLQVGFNYQVGGLVWGVEFQSSWSDVDGRGSCLNSAGDSCRARVEWIGTLAGRLGVTIDRALVYLKAGGAWVHDKHDIILNGVLLDAISDTRWGWMFGTGVEYAISNAWSAKIEYNYIDVEWERYALPGSSRLVGRPVDVEIQQHMHLIKAGVNYRFGSYGLGGLYAGY